jgi:hypothetical protein
MTGVFDKHLSDDDLIKLNENKLKSRAIILIFLERFSTETGTFISDMLTIRKQQVEQWSTCRC